MGIYKDFLLISTGFALGTYLAKTDNNDYITREYHKIMYKLKPILRDIKENIIEFFESSNIDFNLEDFRINIENTIDLLKKKVSQLNEIQDIEKKVEFVKEEIIHLLNSITKAFNSQKEKLEETKIITIDSSDEENQ